MSRFVVVVFPSEAKAYEGTRALKDLHADGSLTLYGMAVIAKNAKGALSIKEAAESGPLGTAVGAMVGGLVGLLAGPVGALAGMASGTLMGSLVDLFNYGVSEEFVLKVSEELRPGRAAIVAELVENWNIPLDTRMGALGGTVLRTWRADFEDEQVAIEVAALEADLRQLRAEYAQANAETKAALKAKLDQANASLKHAEERLQARIDALQAEANAKVAALDKQVAGAKADAKEKIRQHSATLRAEYEARSAKLKQAWALTKQALAA
jgi:uncharacterized membrane protein